LEIKSDIRLEKEIVSEKGFEEQIKAIDYIKRHISKIFIFIFLKQKNNNTTKMYYNVIE